MVFISPPNSRTIFLNLNPKTTTLNSLKQTLHQETQIPISLQNFLIPSNHDDSSLLSQLGISRYSTLILHVPLLGGGGPVPGTNSAAPPPPPANPLLDFLNSKPPPNYVAGLGRGATGFTTQSDIGPARAASDSTDRSATTIGGASGSAGAGRGRGKHGEDVDVDEDEGEDKGYDENQKFDEFEGNDVDLFADSEYDEDDKEADAVLEAIDIREESRINFK